MNPLETVAATGVFTSAWLLIAIPLAVFAILLLVGKASNSWGHWLGTASILASFVLGIVMFVKMLALSPDERSIDLHLFDFLQTGPLNVDFGILLDPLSMLFLLLVTGVGSLIFIYSIGYMAEDSNRRRFFAYLNLFVASMLTLVLANNYLLLFFGWEGVGLASYLLISFWQQRHTAALAGKKAFVANRIGDLGLLVGMFAIFSQIGSLNFVDVDAAIGDVSGKWVTLIGFCLLLAACGKSAQVPLQSWLLDAMEGPTPVSALIHAATMVTAGVYLIVRAGSVYQLSEAAAIAVSIVGAVTLIFGAWIGSAKDDIKKVLAGSTMSQIGYMMLAAAIGPAGAVFAIFHLITHGAFKANMFLGAGSIMHGMNDSVNMREFGALAKAMPWTFYTFAIGYLAIIGFPGLSGFYSKDHIIVVAWERSWVLGAVAMFGAFLTAYYMTRLMTMTFLGNKRWRDDQHPHESPAVMVVPLVILSAAAIVLGVLMNSWIQDWLGPVTGMEPEPTSLLHVPWQGWATLALVAIGVVLGYLLFRNEVPREAPAANPLVAAGRRDLFQDDFNDLVLVRGGGAVVNVVGALDTVAVDGLLVGATSGLSKAVGKGFSKLQSGYVRNYAMAMVVGTVAVGVVLILGRLA